MQTQPPVKFQFVETEDDDTYTFDVAVSDRPAGQLTIAVEDWRVISLLGAFRRSDVIDETIDITVEVVD